MREDVKMCLDVHGVCGEYVDGKIYLHSWQFNGILEINLENGLKKIYRGRQNVSNNCGCLSSDSIMYRDTIYFMPRVSHTILKFNYKTFKKEEIYVENDMNSFEPVIVKDRLYLFPDLYVDRMPCIDLKDDTVIYNLLDVPKYVDLLHGNVVAPVFSGVIQRERYVFRACHFGPYVLKYDFLSCSAKLICIPKATEGFADISYDGTFFWLLSKSGDLVIKWEQERNQVVKLIALQRFSLDGAKAVSVKCLRGKVYFLFDISERILEINCIDETVVVYNPSDMVGFIGGKGRRSFSSNIITDEVMNLYFLPIHANGIVKIDTSGIMHYLGTAISEKAIMEENRSYEMNEHMCTINGFLNVVSERALAPRQSQAIGVSIWRNL